MKPLDRVATKLRLLHYSRKTEINDVSWIKKYILYHNKKHPETMGKFEMPVFHSPKRSVVKATSTCLSLASTAGQQQAHQILTIALRFYAQRKEALLRSLFVSG
jgi:hypothetical protein